MPAPSIGDLNRRITVQSLTQSQDGEGGMVDAWADLCSVWAKVNNLLAARTGNEVALTAHGGQVAVEKTEFTIRYRSGIEASMRIEYNGRHYNIRHVNNYMEDRRFLILTCDTGLNEGR